MIAGAKRNLYLQGELESPTDGRVPILPALSEEELLVLSNFFELLASWEITEKSNVS